MRKSSFTTSGLGSSGKILSFSLENNMNILDYLICNEARVHISNILMFKRSRVVN